VLSQNIEYKISILLEIQKKKKKERKKKKIKVRLARGHFIITEAFNYQFKDSMVQWL
jgi:hypothetical protein